MTQTTLGIDVGGSGIKGMVLGASGEPLTERVRIPTPRPAHPAAVIATIVEVAGRQPPYDRIAIGFPGVVESGVVRTAPNLDGDWCDVPLADEIGQRTNTPCRVLNDADVQGYGVIEGRGVEMVITLGTGMGAAIFTNGHLVPNLELGHHPLRGKRSYEDLVGDAARKRVGGKKWNSRVAAAIDQILPVWNPRRLYVGGGNAKRLNFELPPRVRRVDNLAGILGAFRVWQDEAH